MVKRKIYIICVFVQMHLNELYVDVYKTKAHVVKYKPRELVKHAPAIQHTN